MLSKTIADAQKMREAMRLKFTYRYGDRIQGPQESVAAHTWGMFLVADYLIEKLTTLAPGKYEIDMKKVYQLIIYHDLIEAETGDEDLHPANKERHDTKGEREQQAMKTFPNKLPKEIQTKFISSYTEYEERTTLESKFVKIVDIIEAEFFCFDKGYLFKNWTYGYRESIRRPHFKNFPELEEMLNDILQYSQDNNYFE